MKTEDEIKPEIEENTEENKTGVSNRDRRAAKARQLLVSSQIYKQPRMNQLAIYERLYNNDIPPKLRQMFNAVLPIFSGMVDELLAMFNDEIKLKFKSKNPAQNLTIPKLQAHFDGESQSLTPNAMWNYKARTDRFNAVISGRGNLKEFAYNDPEYTNVLSVTNYSDFHCEPMGGGILENHSFQGTEGNFKTKYELENDPKYDQEQVKKLINFVYADEYYTNLESTYGTKFARWRALGFDPETNSFTGEPTYNLCDFIITDNGVRYNVVFDPVTGISVYDKPWKETRPSGLYPNQSWATHEDDKNFWSKSYADDFFTIADAVITLFNQELTNREKKNYNARAFDKDMFTDVGKLDAAQYRPDALVPANTAGGTKKIAEGLYAFETPELTGTINLIDWSSNYMGQKTGADELPPGSEKNKKAIIQMQQRKQSQRIGLRSASFQECYSRLGTIFIEGCKEYMPPKVSVQVIGENGFIEESELQRIEVERLGPVNISVTSTSEQQEAEMSKKQGQVDAINMVTENPNLTKYEKEIIYRNIGGFDEAEIALLIDKEGMISKKQIAHASQDIQDILLDKKPDVYYGADLAYLNYFKQYLVDHKGHIKGKETKFMEFLDVMGPIVNQNMQDIAKNAPPPPPEQDPNAKPSPVQMKPKTKMTLSK